MELHQFTLKTTKREEIIDITDKVEEYIKASKVRNGLCRIFLPSTTAGITINENADRDVKRDFLTILKKIIPQSRDYLHMEGNSDAHVKSSFVGCFQTVFIQNGRLLLGTWQGLWYCEFDGPRSRPVIVSIEGTSS